MLLFCKVSCLSWSTQKIYFFFLFVAQVVIEGKLDQRGNCSFAQCQDYDSEYVEYENVLPLVGIDELQIRTIYDDCKVNTSGK